MCLRTSSTPVLVRSRTLIYLSHLLAGNLVSELFSKLDSLLHIFSYRLSNRLASSVALVDAPPQRGERQLDAVRGGEVTCHAHDVAILMETKGESKDDGANPSTAAEAKAALKEARKRKDRKAIVLLTKLSQKLARQEKLSQKQEKAAAAEAAPPPAALVRGVSAPSVYNRKDVLRVPSGAGGYPLVLVGESQGTPSTPTPLVPRDDLAIPSRQIAGMTIDPSTAPPHPTLRRLRSDPCAAGSRCACAVDPQSLADIGKDIFKCAICYVAESDEDLIEIQPCGHML